jgi:hypothetical protein
MTVVESMFIPEKGLAHSQRHLGCDGHHHPSHRCDDVISSAVPPAALLLPPKMPKGRKYGVDERECIAKAWAAATLDKVHGADQTSDDFQQRVHNKLKKIEPKPLTPTPLACCDQPERHSDRHLL